MSLQQSESTFIAKSKPVENCMRPKGASPDAYALRLEGDCLMPHLKTGCLVGVERTIPKFNEMGIFYFTNGNRPILKQCRSDITSRNFPHNPRSEVIALLQFRQWNPLRTYTAAANQIQAIHTAKWYWSHGRWCLFANLIERAGLQDEMTSFAIGTSLLEPPARLASQERGV